MHRTDGDGNVGGMYVEEDPALNRMPTEFTAAAMNSFQEELASVIEWAGLALVKADNTQLRQALLSAFVLRRVSNSGGTVNAITAAFTPAVAALEYGMTVYVRASGANTSTTPTFTPNAGVIPVKTIVKGSSGAALEPGDISGAGHWLELTYDSVVDKWVLLNPAYAVSVKDLLPAGTVIHVGGSTAPTGFIKANGAALSRTTYAALFAAIGTTFGAGDGATTFNVPDLRGEFIRGWDDGRGVDSGGGRARGTWQADAYASHNHTINSVLKSGSGFAVGGQTYELLPNTNDYTTTSTEVSTNSGAAGETRPRNVSLLACIKY